MNQIIVSTSFQQIAVVLVCCLVQRPGQEFTFAEIVQETTRYRFFLYGEEMRHCHSRHELIAGVRKALRHLAQRQYLRLTNEQIQAYQVPDPSRLRRRLGSEPLVFTDSEEGHRQIAHMILFHREKVAYLPETKRVMLETFLRLFDPDEWSRLKQRDPTLPWVL